jgi:hypothetical protein
LTKQAYCPNAEFASGSSGAFFSGLAYKLETAAAQAERVDAPPEQLADNWEEIDELADEWEPDEETNGEPERPHYTPQQIADMRLEMAKLREFHALARSIAKNSKGEALLTALRRGFAAAAEAKQGHAGAIHFPAIRFIPARIGSGRTSKTPTPTASATHSLNESWPWPWPSPRHRWRWFSITPAARRTSPH